MYNRLIVPFSLFDAFTLMIIDNNNNNNDDDDDDDDDDVDDAIYITLGCYYVTAGACVYTNSQFNWLLVAVNRRITTIYNDI